MLSAVTTWVGEAALALADLTLSPNPISDKVTLRVFAPRADQANIRVVEVTANEGIFLSESLVFGENTVELSTVKLPAGVYLIRVNTKDKMMTKN